MCKGERSQTVPGSEQRGLGHLPAGPEVTSLPSGTEVTLSYLPSTSDKTSLSTILRGSGYLRHFLNSSRIYFLGLSLVHPYLWDSRISPVHFSSTRLTGSLFLYREYPLLQPVPQVILQPFVFTDIYLKQMQMDF